MNLRRAAFGLAVSAFWVQSAWAVVNTSQTQSAAADVTAAHATLQEATTKAQNNDAAGAEAILKPLLSSTVFPKLSADDQHAAFWLLGALEYDLGKPKEALPYFEQATQSPLANGRDWRLRAYTSCRLENFDGCLADFTVIAKRWPAEVANFNDGTIFMLGDRASETSPDAAIDLLEPLHSAKWHPQDEFEDADSLWFRLAVAYLERGDLAAAQKTMADVQEVGPLIRARSDKRFDAIVVQNPSHFDIEAALTRYIDGMKAKAAAAPNKIEGVNEVAEDLLETNRAQEALDLLDHAIAQTQSTTPPFSDYGTKFNWTLDTRARALFALGRYKDGIEALSNGARRPEGGDVNVSQAINLAGEYNAFNQPKDALNAVSELTPDHASPYGRMALAEVKACAYDTLGDKANRDAQMAYINAHTDDGWASAFKAQICTSNLDDAEKLAIARLKNPLTRDSMLYYMQDFVSSPGETAREKEDRARFIAIRSRPDVAAEISAVGRIASYPLLTN